jgi:hypothetical protein
VWRAGGLCPKVDSGHTMIFWRFRKEIDSCCRLTTLPIQTLFLPFRRSVLFHSIAARVRELGAGISPEASQLVLALIAMPTSSNVRSENI